MPHSLIVSFAFALVQLVGQIDAAKPFAKDFGFGWRSLATEPGHTRSSRNRLFLTVLQKEAKRRIHKRTVENFSNTWDGRNYTVDLSTILKNKKTIGNQLPAPVSRLWICLLPRPCRQNPWCREAVVVDELFDIAWRGGSIFSTVYRMCPRSVTQSHRFICLCASAVGWANWCWKAFR